MNWKPLVITITCDPRLQDPRNPRCDELWTVDAIAKDYIDANAAGATMDHVHGLYWRDPIVQADGKQLQIPDLDGTRGDHPTDSNKVSQHQYSAGAGQHAAPSRS